jgi:hypothetical protein
MRTTAIVMLAATCAVACASTPVPADKYARARAAIKSAEVMNVERQPNAAAHLRIAREEVEQAKTLLQKGENEEAGYVLLRAEADADVAMNLAREAYAKQEAMATIQQVNQMQAQMQQMEGR